MAPVSQLVGGRYALREAIGRGGMGTVWRADDELLGRPVAVKEVLPPPGLAPDEREQLHERTLREARAAARSRSRSAVTIYDVVEQDDRAWIVMELLDSRTLREVLTAEGPRPPAQVARIGLAVLDALEAAHRRGVVHRDVKPENILLCDDGRIVLTDFGIAALDGEATGASAGTVLGTAAYMAPERLRGELLSPAVDLWSLGATLYAALEGVSPFQRSDMTATVAAVLNDPVPPPPQNAGPLAPVLLGLLQPDPQQRLTVADAGALLSRALPAAAVALSRPAAPADAAPAHEPTRTLPPADRPARRRRSRGRRGLLLPVVLLLFAVLVLVVERWPRTDASDGAGSLPAVVASDSASATPGPGPAASAAPTSYRTYRDPSGFSVDVPEGWTEGRGDRGVDFRGPGGSHFLNVRVVSDPAANPEAEWRQQESYVARELPGYQLLGIRPVQYRQWPAADWDFTWQSQDGRLRVRNRYVVTDPDRGYALYFSVPEGQWEANQGLFEAITRSFRPGS